MSAEEIRHCTIKGQLALEFAARLEMEADAWLAVSVEKRQKAVQYRAEAHALDVKAAALRKVAKVKA